MKALCSGKGEKEKNKKKNPAKSIQATKIFLCTHKTCKQSNLYL